MPSYANRFLPIAKLKNSILRCIGEKMQNSIEMKQISCVKNKLLHYLHFDLIHHSFKDRITVVMENSWNYYINNSIKRDMCTYEE